MDEAKIRAVITDTLVSVEPRLSEVVIGAETTLPQLGIDSLRLIEVGAALEESFGADIGFEQWLDEERRRPPPAFSLGSLARFIRERRTAQ